MKVKIDFSLAPSMGSVEMSIFNLMIHGVNNLPEIRKLLCLFSDEVVANAIRKLVNRQIINCNVRLNILKFSDPMMILLDNCNSNDFELAVPNEIIDQMENGILRIDDNEMKRSVLNVIAGDCEMEYILKTIDFYIIESESKND